MAINIEVVMKTKVVRKTKVVMKTKVVIKIKVVMKINIVILMVAFRVYVVVIGCAGNDFNMFF